MLFNSQPEELRQEAQARFQGRPDNVGLQEGGVEALPADARECSPPKSMCMGTSSSGVQLSNNLSGTGRGSTRPSNQLVSMLPRFLYFSPTKRCALARTSAQDGGLSNRYHPLANGHCRIAR